MEREWRPSPAVVSLSVSKKFAARPSIREGGQQMVRLMVVSTIAAASFAASVYAGNGCTDVCAQKNRAEVRACNYPEKESGALKACLATAKANYDICKNACGK